MADRLRVPHPSRLDPSAPDYARILAAHAAALGAGEPGYVDPRTGFFVFTAATLLERGWCCERGCRHCPYVGTDAERPSSPLPS